MKRKVTIYLKPIEKEIEFDDDVLSEEEEEVIDNIICNCMQDEIIKRTAELCIKLCRKNKED